MCIRDREEPLVKQMAQKAGLTEQMKAEEMCIRDRLDTTIHKVGAEPQLYTVAHNQTANDVTE